MGTAFLHGNGSGFNLNFSVKNYASSSVLLADTPKENTIGIVSTVSIPRWRFTSITSPSSTSPNGFIYINAVLDGDNRWSTSKPTFDLVNKNDNMILLKPTGCIQLIDGSWKAATAYIYKQSTWVQFSTAKYYIVNSGGTADYTGGWTKAGNASGGESSDGSIFLTTSSNASGSITMTTGISNFAGYSKLKIVQSTKVDNHTFALIDSSGNTLASATTYTSTSPVEIDLSSLGLSGSSLYRFRIQGGLIGGTSGATTTVTQVWLE